MKRTLQEKQPEKNDAGSISEGKDLGAVESIK